MTYKSCQVFLLKAKKYYVSGNAACENEQKCRDNFVENSLRRGNMKKLGVPSLNGQI